MGQPDYYVHAAFDLSVGETSFCGKEIVDGGRDDFSVVEARRGEPLDKDINCPKCIEVAKRDLVTACNRSSDTVNHPAHYTAGKVECIDALEAATEGLVGIEAFCTANAIKYLWRWRRKGGVEDLKKARWYIERLIARFSK